VQLLQALPPERRVQLRRPAARSIPLLKHRPVVEKTLPSPLGSLA